MSRKRVIVVTVGIMLSLFMAAVESTVVATAMPTIVSELGGLAFYSWVFTAYMLTSTTTCRSPASCPTSSAANRSSWSPWRCSWSARCCAGNRRTWVN